MSRIVNTITPVLGAPARIPSQERGRLADGRELPLFYDGRIVYINAAHRWYLVEADIGGAVIREGFKF